MGSFWYSALYLALLGIAAHFIGEALPRRFHAEKFPFAAFGWEKNGQIYKVLGVHHWKDHVPDMSRIMPDMTKKRINTGTHDAAQLPALIEETCVAELTHWILILLSPVVCLLWRSGWSLLLLAFDIFALNLPFIVIQRYNRPKLVRVWTRLQSKKTAGTQMDASSKTSEKGIIQRR